MFDCLSSLCVLSVAFVLELSERWTKVEQSLSRVEKVLRHTMIDWREYEELYVAGCDFVSYVREITGEEQLEGSMGDIQLLPKFIVCADSILMDCRVLFFAGYKFRLVQ